MRRFSSIGVIALAALAAGTLSACGGGGSSSPAATTPPTSNTSNAASAGGNQSITVVTGAEPESLDPQKEDDDGQNLVLWSVYEGLYEYNVKDELEPQLAEAMPEQINSKTWQVKLRKGVKFSDGEPFNAESAIYSIERIISPKEESSFSEAFTIASVSEVDEHTIQIKTTGVDPLLSHRLAVIKMLAPHAKNFPQQTTGTGPYKLKSYTPSSGAVLTYNPMYRGEEPQVTQVHVNFVPDAGTRIQALNTGEADLDPGIGPAEAEEAPSVVASTLPVYIGEARINTEAPGPLHDVRVRQALNYAVNDDELTKSLFGDYAEPASCQLTPKFIGDPDLEGYPYEPEKAQQLVKEAGATGETINLVWTTGVFPEDRAMGEAVAQELEQTGLKIHLELDQYNVFLKAIYAHGPKAPDLVFTESDNNFASALARMEYFYLSTGPVSSYSNPKMDALYKKAVEELNEEKRQELINQIAELGCKEAPMLWLYERKEVYGLSERLQYTPLPLAYSKLWYNKMKVVK